MKLSVTRSTFAVASSRTNTLVFLIMALARQKSCFWPNEKRLLLSVRIVERLFVQLFSMWLHSLTSLSVLMIYSSSNSWKGSMFSLIVPWIKNGCWGM